LRAGRPRGGRSRDHESLPDWDYYAADFREGVPLLQSSNAAPDLEPAGKWIVSAVERLAAEPLAGGLGQSDAMIGGGRFAHHIASRIEVGEGIAAVGRGHSRGLCAILRHVGWT
jgi:hypothetical protein